MLGCFSGRICGARTRERSTVDAVVQETVLARTVTVEEFKPVRRKDGGKRSLKRNICTPVRTLPDIPATNRRRTQSKCAVRHILLIPVADMVRSFRIANMKSMMATVTYEIREWTEDRNSANGRIWTILLNGPQPRFF